MDNAEPSAPSAALSTLSRARLDELLSELLQRVGGVMDTQDRLRGLLDAVVTIAADLSLDRVLPADRRGGQPARRRGVRRARRLGLRAGTTPP